MSVRADRVVRTDKRSAEEQSRSAAACYPRAPLGRRTSSLPLSARHNRTRSPMSPRRRAAVVVVVAVFDVFPSNPHSAPPPPAPKTAARTTRGVRTFCFLYARGSPPPVRLPNLALKVVAAQMIIILRTPPTASAAAADNFGVVVAVSHVVGPSSLTYPSPRSRPTTVSFK